MGNFYLFVLTACGRLMSFFLRSIRLAHHRRSEKKEARSVAASVRRSGINALFVAGIVFPVFFLTPEAPAFQFMYLAQAAESGHASHMQHAMEGPEPVLSLEIRPEKITAGVPSDMTVRIRNQEGQPLKGLELSHERMLHAVIISRDLNIFAHIHPEDAGPVTDEMLQRAALPLRYTFPKAGEYLIGIDYAVAGNLYSRIFSVNVAGKPEMGASAADFSLKKTFGEYSVSLAISPDSIVAGKPAKLTYIIEKDGKAVTDLEPYLGAAMHLAVVPSSLKLFIHAHGITPEEPHAPLGHMHATTLKQFGPEIDAYMVFPSRGVYKIFSQVKHQGKVLLFDFMLNVQ